MPGEADHLRLLTVNVGNPSEDRAERQLEWLATRPEEILVLTETKASMGCQVLSHAFQRAGYLIAGVPPPPGQYGALIASRLYLEPDGWICQRLHQRERVASALIRLSNGGALRIIAVYVPSRDASPEKVDRKRRFLAELAEELLVASNVPAVLIGDFNILEPDHRPRYPFFKPFEYDFYRHLRTYGWVDAYRLRHPKDDEYSWVGRTGDGYRYDHAFVSEGLASAVLDCAYLHDIRKRAGRWTDHSALTLGLDMPGATRLPCDPTALLPSRLF